MVELKLHGGLIEIIESNSNVAVTNEPISGENLKKIAQDLSLWMNGITFKNDCYLSGLDGDDTKEKIAQIIVCADRNEAVLL